MKLKKISDQVIVITGASSGIGLTTARMAAERGAKVMINSRNEAELQKICDELNAKGLQVRCCAGDVAIPEDMERLADETIQNFGRIDTWVNNAGVFLIGKLEQASLDEKRRLFDVNFWGLVHGTRVALPNLKEKGGAIINVGSVESDRVVPLHGIYAASKHAVKAYTDALRMEVEHDKLPISVTLIKPASIDTDLVNHARLKLNTGAKNPGPVYAPEIVARGILHCAEHPTRDLLIGGAGLVYSVLGKFAPRFADKFMEGTMFRIIPDDSRPHDSASDALFDVPKLDGRETGDEERRVRKFSIHSLVARNKKIAATAVALPTAVLGFFALKKSKKSEHASATT